MKRCWWVSLNLILCIRMLKLVPIRSHFQKIINLTDLFCSYPPVISCAIYQLIIPVMFSAHFGSISMFKTSYTLYILATERTNQTNCAIKSNKLRLTCNCGQSSFTRTKLKDFFSFFCSVEKYLRNPQMQLPSDC